MKKNSLILVAAASVMLTTSCATKHYQLQNVERSRILIDKRFDGNADAKAEAFLAPYKHQVDSIMSPVVGEIDHYMAATRPESDLSNLLADIMVWGGKEFNEKPDVGLYNMGGIRAAIAKGKVTYGDVVDVAPFENRLCFITLKGSDLIELFAQVAARGGEGVSHGVEMVITNDCKLVSVKLNGADIDPNKDYRVATIDYLAQGNDGLKAFLKGKDLFNPGREENDSRFVIMDYFKEKMAAGEIVNSRVEGRITIADK